MENVILQREEAKHRLAVNLLSCLDAQDKGYKWLADELTKRLETPIYVSRIQKILEQTSSAEWSLIVSIAGVMGCQVEDFGKKPSPSAERRYRERFGKPVAAHA